MLAYGKQLTNYILLYVNRKVLEAKRKQLKSQGKGNKKNRLLMLMRPKHCMRNSYLVQVCRYFTFQNKRKLTPVSVSGSYSVPSRLRTPAVQYILMLNMLNLGISFF
jgi:hypothetical protein